MSDVNRNHNRPIVAHYYTEWLPGTMTWLFQLISDLQIHCNNVILCEKTVHNNRFDDHNLYDFSKLPKTARLYQKFLKKTGLVTSLPFYVKKLNEKKVNLLHSHFGHIAVQGCKIARDAGIPHVASFYGMDLRQIPESDPDWYGRYHDMFTRTRRIFCEGKYMAERIGELGCPPEKITVHPLGIDLEKTTFNPLNLDESGPLCILIASSFREKKGIPLALEAVAGIRDTISVRVTVIGDAGSDPASQKEQARILKTMNKHKMEDIVTLRGFLPHEELMKEARLHHIYLAPSIHASDGDSEGGVPVSIIEMSASGMMVVSSRHCDIPGVIRHGETGWLAEEGNLEDLIKQLRKAVESRNKWREMAEVARSHIANNFESRNQANKLVQHYLEVIG